MSSNRSRGRSLTDMGVASDLAKDVCLSPRGFSHLLQLLRTQSLSCHLHDFHCKLMASSSMNTTADHRAHSSARVRQHRSQGRLLSHFHQSRASAPSYTPHQVLETLWTRQPPKKLVLTYNRLTVASAATQVPRKVPGKAGKAGPVLVSNPASAMHSVGEPRQVPSTLSPRTCPLP